MKAVIVEDEILIREGLCKLMQKMFPEIMILSVAGNGQEGLACIERDKPDLVITDIKMPVMGVGNDHQNTGIRTISKSNRINCVFGIFLRTTGC